VWYVYFIKSVVKSDIIYVGHTKDIEERLVRHNQKRERYTKKFAPFELIYTEKFATKSEAAKREYFFKTPAGRAEKRNIVEKIMGSSVG